MRLDLREQVFLLALHALVHLSLEQELEQSFQRLDRFFYILLHLRASACSSACFTGGAVSRSSFSSERDECALSLLSLRRGGVEDESLFLSSSCSEEELSTLFAPFFAAYRFAACFFGVSSELDCSDLAVKADLGYLLFGRNFFRSLFGAFMLLGGFLGL